MDTSPDINPLISPETCRAWLANLPAADPLAVATALADALEDIPAIGSFNALKVLESLRAPVLQVQESLATRFADKLLPLLPAQATALSACTTLSRRMADACAAGIAVSQTDPGEYGRLSALLYQRSIFWAVQGMIDCLRARQRVPDELWNIAQNLVAGAGRAGLLETAVRDSLQPEGRSTIAATYVRGLLLHMCGARSLTAREFDYVRQIAHLFERKVGLAYATLTIPSERGGTAVAPAEGTRVKTLRLGAFEHTLDVSGLARSIGGRLTELNQGKMFESPVLVPASTLPVLRALFGKLYGAWCSRSNMRRFPRRRRSETVFCAFEPELIYGLMKRRRYEPPPPPKVYNHVEVANIFLNASGVPFKEQMHTPESWQQVLATLDCWQTLEESATGLSMQRGVNAGGARVRRGQLAAIRHGAQGTAMVGEIRWAEQTSDGRVEVGLEMLPGLARAGAVRYADANTILQSAGKSPCAAALILDNFKRNRTAARDGNAADPGVPQGPSNPLGLPTALPSIDEDMLNKTGANAALRRYTEQATILLPIGWTREGAVIEFIDGPASLKLRIRAIASRHGDLERMFFEVIS